MPVSLQNNSSSDNIYSNYNNIVFGEIDESRIDYSSLSNVGPDINFTISNKQLTTWLSANKLTEMANTTLHQVNFTNFVGVINDDKLDCIHHISYIKNKISKGMGILLKARHFLNKTAVIYIFLNIKLSLSFILHIRFW